MDKYRFFALPLIMIMLIILMVGCGSGGGDSGQDQSVPPAPPVRSVWSKTYHTGSGTSVAETSGGYVIVGTANDFAAVRGTDMYFALIDTTGNIIGYNELGDTNNDFGRSVHRTYDALGYIVLGEYTSGNDRQMWLVKMDNKGNDLWHRYYGYSDAWESAAEVSEILGSGYIVVGTTGNPRNVFLVRTDKNGDVLWYKQKGYDDSNESAASIEPTWDGGFVFTGTTDQFDSNGDIWLVKVGADGSTLWHHHYGVSGIAEESTSVRETFDNGYIITGTMGPSTNRDIFLLKTDSAGNQQWFRTFGGSKSDYGAALDLTIDGGYVIAGSTQSYGNGGSDGYLIRTDAQGNTLWTNTFGGPNDDYFYSVTQTTDGGYIMAGSTVMEGVSYIYVVKTDANGSSLP